MRLFVIVLVLIVTGCVLFDVPGRCHVTAKGMSYVVGITKVKVTFQINALKHFDVSLFVGMEQSDGVVGDVNHSCVFDFVNRVVSYHSYFSTFCY